jgi:hypothetical protein
MCVYESILNEQADASKDFKLISDIKDAVGFLSEHKMRKFDDGLHIFRSIIIVLIYN